MSRGSDKLNRGRVRRLWSKSKYCHWCKKETKLQPSGVNVVSSNTATFDHLYHRSQPERKLYPRKGVLACYECNHRRGRVAFIKSLPLWRQWLIAVNLHRPIFRIKRSIYTFARERGLIE